MSLHEGLDTQEEQRETWDDYARWGSCDVCGKEGPVTRHHVVYRQHVRNHHGDEWDPDNSMLVGGKFGRCNCHANHHHGSHRIPVSKVPERAIAFACALMGQAAAHYYFRRYYGHA